MTSINIFVSFEYGKDNMLKDAFYAQAERYAQHAIRNHSLNEPYQENGWKGKASTAIRKCDIVFVLVGQDTHNASGVRVETDMAKSLKKPVIQVLCKKARQNNYKGVPHIEDRISWKWKRINKRLEKIWTRKQPG